MSFICFNFIGCNGKILKEEELLIGQWQSKELNMIMEFSKDNTYSTGSEDHWSTGKWEKTNNKELTLTPDETSNIIDFKPSILNYEVSDTHLLMKTDNKNYKFVKIENKSSKEGNNE